MTTYVTNGVSHARRLAAMGFKTMIIGGELKESTEAVVGGEALNSLEKFLFYNRLFWGKRDYEKERIYYP